jgi:NAD(P)-dependent dehydrogenase (short-subunit alcohol dehydrogenase family)/acyl carrier protein
MVEGVVSLLALQEQRHPACGSVPKGLAASTALVQALGDVDVIAPLWLVTRGAVSVAPSDVLSNPLQAQVWGLGMVVGLEHPQRWGGVVDLPESFDDRVGSLFAGLLANAGGEDQLAVRGAGVFARRIARAVRGEGQAGVGAWSPPAGTILITGGTGGLGARIARWLAERGAEHLLLVSRSGKDAPGAGRLQNELVGMGAEVTIAACDVADRDQLAALIDSLPKERSLRMVVHGAGVTGHGTIDSLAVDDFEQGLSAKAHGALNLDALTQDLDLSAFMLLSSIAGTFGSGQQAPYAAANAYLDGLALARRARGLPATSIAWGPWEGDGIASQEGVGEVMRKRGLQCIPPELALEALQGALLADETLLVVADIRWDTYARLFTSARSRPLIEGLPEVQSALESSEREDDRQAGRELRARVLEASAEERRRLLLELVRVEVARVMGQVSPETMDPKRAFKELGFDSLMAVDLHRRLGVATGLELPATLVFDYPTPLAVIEHLLTELTADGPSASTVEPELAGLERALSALRDEKERRHAVGRLRALLAGLESENRAPLSHEEQSPVAVVERLQTASDDEIFEFIDRQLGSSQGRAD